MKYLSHFLAFLVMLSVCLPALSQNSAPPTADSKSLERVLNEYVTAVRQYDAKTLERLFDREYVEVSPLGDMDDRAKTLGYYRVSAEQRPPSPDNIALSEMQTRFLNPDAAVVIARETVEMTVSGKKMTRDFRATFTLRKTAGEWRLFSAHFAALRPAPK